MSKILVVEVGENQTRAAILQDGLASEMHIENVGERTLTGSIYKGVVSNILPGLQSAFVDAGLSRDIFVHISDLSECPTDAEGRPEKSAPIEDILHVGQEIAVQIAKDPVDAKGARGGTRISLPGLFAVLLPCGGGRGISHRIADPEERERLRAMIEEIAPENMGLILRTAAEGESQEAIRQDVESLLALWGNIEKKIGSMPRHSLIHRDLGLILKLVRDIVIGEAAQLIIDSKKEYESIRDFVGQFAPEMMANVKLWPHNKGLFSHYNLDIEVEKLVEPLVYLDSGASLIIERTQALTVIDVNTGRFFGGDNLEDSAFKTNLEAADEIARQLRLRNISGLIVVDFIDMQEQAHRDLVMEKLRQELKKDRIRTSAAGFTRHGLVEITRKRRNSLNASFISKTCPLCSGKGIIISLLEKI